LVCYQREEDLQAFGLDFSAIHIFYDAGSLIGEWIQTDFQAPKLVTGVITQGRHRDYAQWITSFKIAYGNDTNRMSNIVDHDFKDKVIKTIITCT